MTATGSSRKSVVERLLQIAPADPTWTHTSMYYEEFNKNLEITELLLMQQHEGGAIENYQAELTTLLLFRGGNVWLSEMFEGRKVLQAVLPDPSERLSLLLASSPSQYVDSLDLRVSALHLAADGGYFRVIDELIKMGADIHKMTTTLKPTYPLKIAYLKRDLPMIAFLVRNGAKLIDNDDHGIMHYIPLLHYSIRMRYKEVATQLLDTGAAMLDEYDEYGFTALQVAVRYRLLDMVKLCIKYKPDVNTRSKEGLTALLYAAQRGDQSMVKLLLESGAIICNRKVHDCDFNILELMLYWKNKEAIAKMLIERGAVSILKLNSGITIRGTDKPIIFYKNVSIKLLAEIVFLNPKMLNIVEPHLNHDHGLRESEIKKLKEYYELCMEELARMRGETILGGVTFLDLLRSDNKAKIVAYCRNEEFEERLSRSGFEQMFPVHSDDLARRYNDARTRAALLAKAEESLVRSTPFPLPTVCAQKVLEYLQDVELTNFIKGTCSCKDRPHTCGPEIIANF